ncbi:hypothetical protein BG74_02950 [Sodalis-like endosymbiont of Proechinophthirus fluctus]|uniref:hypothetical protein n=1 Tax=Sodalis-like endosymbiont of Proechinophthirus fluctus TaxID=1462730 RepID=UPI0007A8FC87|nr:hypothetical protein [Sodalis-like endosymbiont of Proechinophthirus fluctus]KYP97477.1 hypothetical protein BG74_02950 [Sodalis-like endosymbiont of Proechinophthirus fluctus]
MVPLTSAIALCWSPSFSYWSCYVHARLPRCVSYGTGIEHAHYPHYFLHIYLLFYYLTISIPLAILSGFNYTTLGFTLLIAGIAISVQYFSTPANCLYMLAVAPTFWERKKLFS